MPNMIKVNGEIRAMATAYESLLVEYQPRTIYNERDHERALSALDRLMRCAGAKPTVAQRDMIDLLAGVIERYEAEYFPMQQATPGELLKHLLENRGMTQRELARATAVPQSTIANVIAGRRGVSKANARKLADFFCLDVGAFIE